MEENILINLKFGDGRIPVKINPRDEAMYRKAAKEVENKINAYRQYYKNLEYNRILTMTAFDFALECIRLANKNDVQPYTEKLEKLSELLEKAIIKNQHR